MYHCDTDWLLQFIAPKIDNFCFFLNDNIYANLVQLSNATGMRTDGDII